VEVLGNTLTWRSVMGRNGLGQSITITRRPTETFLEGQVDLRAAAIGLFGGFGGGFGGGLGINALVWTIITHSILLGTATAAVFAASFLIPRAIYPAVARRRMLQLERLLDGLAAKVERDP
jgi:hypothetical protein